MIKGSVMIDFKVQDDVMLDDTVARLAKSKDDKNYVFGWASVVRNRDGGIPLDWQGDVLDEADIEESAYDFVRNYRVTGIEHQGEAFGELIESVMFTTEKQLALGIPTGVLPIGWFVGFYIEDDAKFELVKSGKLKMFSVQGMMKRIKISD